MSYNHNKETISVLTFNILAPCYKRLSSESDRESLHPNLWLNRHQSIIDLIQSLNLDLICLQEYWLSEKSFIELYQSILSTKYSFHYVQRTHNLADGLAILIDRHRFQLVNKVDLLLNDIGNRVGLLLHLNFREHPLILVNIHLTFPHDSFDIELRLKQMTKFLQMIDEYINKLDLFDRCSIILCGDLNSPFENDPVYQLLNQYFKSSYCCVHGLEPLVTHLTHRNEELCTDFIFFRSNRLTPTSSELFPKDCDPSLWKNQQNNPWKLSDHRALQSDFEFK